MRIDFTLFGEAASKANSRQIAFTKPTESQPLGRRIVIKGEKALGFEKSAGYQIPTYAQLRLEGPVRVTAVIYYASERPDLDESLLLDILQDQFQFVGAKENRKKYLARPGVYQNDRQVRHKDIRHAIDKIQPRVEVRIEQLFMFVPTIEGFMSIDAQREREIEFRRSRGADKPNV